MVLLTGLYQDADKARSAELMECLRRNVKNDLLDEVHVLIEDSVEPDWIPDSQLASPKVRAIKHSRRVTYRHLFAYASKQLAGRRVIIANADIYFDHSLACLDNYDLSGKLLCLSRWDVQPDGSGRFFEHPFSQDAWIFQSPIRAFPCDFYLGVLGCDNRVAWEADHAGLAVSNPSRSVRAYHLHLSGIRRYNSRQRLMGPTKSVPAIFLETPLPDPESILEVPYARVAFRESMGYTVARLEAGVSSHNNDPRPFTLIAERLAGRQFTQVVASSVSPVEVEFLSDGKLFVLVGDDWDGYNVATAWLSQTGCREGLPSVRTQRGTGFEVWSLVGEAGQRYVLPTQVMLVADRLIRSGA